MKAVVVIRSQDEKNNMEIIQCADEDAQEVLETKYYSELYNLEYVFDCKVRNGFGRIEGPKGEMVFSLINLKERK